VKSEYDSLDEDVLVFVSHNHHFSFRPAQRVVPEGWTIAHRQPSESCLAWIETHRMVLDSPLPVSPHPEAM
jgi:uncharacterized protein YbdZ (MbtH family)